MHVQGLSTTAVWDEGEEQVSQIPPGPEFSDVEMCPFDKCPITVCGGPHVVVRTDIGDEIVGPGQTPLGTPVSEMSEAERIAHMEAEANAQRDDNPA